EAGVKKLVLLSGRGEVEAENAEQALKSCGVDWTILRCSFFSQNFSESFFLDPILAGEVALPVRAVAEPFVDAEDIADVAVAALTQAGHSRKLYELTGPRALTFADAIAEIARAVRRDIRYLPVTAEEYRSALLQAEVPKDVVDLVLYLFDTVLDGRNTPVADGVQRAVGRPPRDFADYVQRTAATGVWSAGSYRPNMQGRAPDVRPMNPELPAISRCSPKWLLIDRRRFLPHLISRQQEAQHESTRRADYKRRLLRHALLHREG